MVGESCIPGISTDNYQSIFEEQVVVASQISGGNLASHINSTIFSIEEKIFFFGTMVPSKVPEGIEERFKIINPNKVGCTVRLEVKKRTANQMEQFAFEISPKVLKIAAHEHSYIKVLFRPTIMATYSGLFEAIVD
jgi:hydrocephalus-inducing protein